jgi:esterase/lipase superfamily enzyme
MDIYFATNRNVTRETTRTAEFGERFHPDGPQFFRVGVAQVEQADPEATGDEAWTVKSRRLYSEKGDKPGEVVRASQDMFEDLRQRLKNEQQDVLVYIHGYANGFDNSIARAAALQALYDHAAAGKGPDPLVFAFAWPSNGKVFPAVEYFSDRDDAEMSGIAMARALAALIDFMARLFHEDRPAIRDARLAGRVPAPEDLERCGQRLHLLAHSMGNWALRHAVLALSRYLGRRPLPRLFKNALLVAADEDADALGDEDKLGLLFELAQSIHVYHSADDRALHFSDATKFNPNRLGADGPSDLANLPPRVFTVDCGLVDETILEHGRHQYYRIRKEVIGDIRAIIAGTSPDAIAETRRHVIRPGRSWRLLPTG